MLLRKSISLIFAALVLVAGQAVSGQDKPKANVTIQWLGHAAFKITSVQGKVILIDPYLTKNPTAPERFKDLKALGKVDLILVTHAHGDHLGDAPQLARMNNAPLLAPNGLSLSLLNLNVLPKDLLPRFNKGGVFAPIGPGITVTMTRAEHSSELVWENPGTEKKEVHVGGEPAGFIVQLENGFKIYHMGDTGLFGDMMLIGELYAPDLVLMPIGGRMVMSPRDAAYATKVWLKPRHVVPMHYGTGPHLPGTPEEYLAALGRTRTRVHVMKPGDELKF